jgi:hypothetical protein
VACFAGFPRSGNAFLSFCRHYPTMRPLLLAALLGLWFAGPAAANSPPVGPPALSIMPPVPGMLCREAIALAERANGIPDHLLAAIGRVESGRRDVQSGAWHPWPWTLNAEGEGHFYDSKAEAVAAVRALQARGVSSIDVGCMQVNLMHHPNAFASLEQALDPRANAAYAARFLAQLYQQANSWPRAAALYHSATPELGAEYERKVIALWPEEQRNAPGTPPAQMTASWPASPMGFARALGAGPMTIMNRAAPARIIPLAAGPGGLTLPGRSLDAYRAAPILMAGRLPGRPLN